MENLTDVFSKFFTRFKASNPNKKAKDSLLFTKLFSEELLSDLQLNICDYARNHIKNFDPDQDYQKLKKLHNKKNLFVDTKYPTKDSSVFLSNDYEKWLQDQGRLSPDGHIIWRRAKDISKYATMAVDKDGIRCNHLSTNEEIKNCYNTADINQGLIGNWFIFSHIFNCLYKLKFSYFLKLK